MYWLIAIPILSRKEFRQNKLVQKPQTISWDEGGMTFTSPDSKSVVAWKDLNKWKKNKKYFLLYISRRLFLCLPKRLFPDEQVASEFEQQLINSGIKYVRP
jgi:hypothetical protein